MKTYRTQTRCTLAAAALIGLAGPAVAGGSDLGVAGRTPDAAAASHEQYRQAVIGQVTDTARRDPRADIGGRWIAGPLAMQHARHGLSMAHAASLARDKGEFPLFVPNDAVRARHLLSARGRW